MITIEYVLKIDWPPLAWLATCGKTLGATVKVMHGPKVETSENFFCEAVWDGDFQSGDIDCTDIVAGSGGRVRDGRLIFVSAGNTVDRLHFLDIGQYVLVSNSMACLSEAGNVSFKLKENYYDIFHSVVRGFRACMHQISTDGGIINLVYYDNLLWDGQTLSRLPKPAIQRDFSEYSSYVSWLKNCLERVRNNSEHFARKHPYRLMGTLSSGYDSTTIAAISKDILADMRVFTFAHGYTGAEDSGADIASCLGIECIGIESEAWRNIEGVEIPHISGNCFGEEIHYSGAESLLHGSVLLTGFHGDRVWGKGYSGDSDELVRGDPSGSGLTEYRLWSGFIHCPLPFWGARQIKDIVRISESEALADWDILQGNRTNRNH